MSIANWWADNFGSRTNQSKSLRLVWSVRTEDVAQLREVQDLQITMAVFRNMDFIIHVSSQGGRIDTGNELSSFLGSRVGSSNNGAWVYVSGPDGLLIAVETACVKQAKLLRQTNRHGNRQQNSVDASTAIKKLEWYVARWSL